MCPNGKDVISKSVTFFAQGETRIEEHYRDGSYSISKTDNSGTTVSIQECLGGLSGSNNVKPQKTIKPSKIYNNKKPVTRSKRIARKISQAAGVHYKVRVTDTCISGGAADGQMVCISKWANETVSDDGLAFIISHEYAHNMLNHPQEAHTDKIEMFDKTEDVLIKGGIIGALIITSIIHIRNRARARNMEREADNLAISLMKEAGFNPQKGAEYLKIYSGDQGGIFATHPSAEERVNNIAHYQTQLSK
ncbi:MAG: M48 family metalloprotease [Patescibacteria group bacterium]